MVEKEQLFDLMFDPNESYNLANDPAKADVLADMRHRLEAWMQATDDPLLDGEVPRPEGAVVSKPTDVNPADLWNYTERREGMG